MIESKERFWTKGGFVITPYTPPILFRMACSLTTLSFVWVYGYWVLSNTRALIEFIRTLFIVLSSYDD